MNRQSKSAIWILFVLLAIGCWIYFQPIFTQRTTEFKSTGFSANVPSFTLNSSSVTLTTDRGWRLNDHIYRPPPTSGVLATGTPMQVSEDLLHKLGIPLREFYPLTSQNVRDFVIVTGSSSNHFRESFDAVAGAQRHFPHHTLYYYDLGLLPEQIDQISSWCNVSIRKFNFDLYPPHVRELQTYAFKPLIIQEVLLEHRGGALWMDASFRILTGNWNEVYGKLLRPGGGLYSLYNGGVPVYVTTHKALYTYVPVDEGLVRDVHTAAAGGLLIHNTEKIYKNILYWWYLCSLDRECIAPMDNANCFRWRRCVKPGRGATCWAKCHRYDLSVLNVLLKNYFGHSEDYPRCFVVPSGADNRIVDIQRHDTKQHHIKLC